MSNGSLLLLSLKKSGFIFRHRAESWITDSCLAYTAANINGQPFPTLQCDTLNRPRWVPISCTMQIALFASEYCQRFDRSTTSGIDVHTSMSSGGGVNIS